MSGSWTLARLAIFLAALAAGGLTTALILTGGLAESPSLQATMSVVIGLSWCLTGLGEWSLGNAA